jgi:deoxyribodipyrimidine photo-lyase
MTDKVLFWHRRDLRLVDNVGLAAASRAGQTIGVFCFDPTEFNSAQIAPASVSYGLESLALLQQEYRSQGSDLIVLRGNPVTVIPQLMQQLGIKALYCNKLVEPRSRELGRQLTAALTAQGDEIYPFMDALLHAPTEIYTGSNNPYSVYTPYWRTWNGKPKPEPLLIAKLTKVQLPAGINTQLPTLSELGWEWNAPQLLMPGTNAAIERLELFTSKAIESYGEARNFPALDGTSMLSAALAWGTIGIRTVWQATIEAMSQARGLEAQESITTWRQELAWREFYWQALYHFPGLATGPHRSIWQKFPWSDDRSRFEAWCAGKTGYPIVDAAMRQLNETGWMHNRCRMIVASFLTKDLIINWQWGEQYFMQTLVDGDLAANNGGWQWSASSGMDPKPLRIFNPSTQALKFDKEAEYIRRWLPELKSVPAADLISGNIAPLWRTKSGYVEPIVDHAVQQREFKRLYQELKAGEDPITNHE